MPCVLSFVIVIATAVVLLVADAAQAQEKRFALLIGNQAYDASVGLLKNPHNDIAVVAAALKTQGFEILPLVRDAKRTEILGAVRGLAARLRTAGSGAVGFLYYSGHGAAEKDTNINYLIPIDARDPGSVGFWDSSLKLDDVMMLLEGARSAVKFVVFDACRNELQLPTRDTSKGLLPVAEQQGYFVAYASAPGRTASDRGAASGPYAAALANELGRQGLDHLNLFQNVKEKVIASTGGSQHPWESNGLSRRIYLTGEPTTEADKELWNKVRSTSDPTELQAYLDQYPKGLYAATAEQMMARLTADAQRRAEEREAAADRHGSDRESADSTRSARRHGRSRGRAASRRCRTLPRRARPWRAAPLRTDGGGLSPSRAVRRLVLARALPSGGTVRRHARRVARQTALRRDADRRTKKSGRDRQRSRVRDHPVCHRQ